MPLVSVYGSDIDQLLLKTQLSLVKSHFEESSDSSLINVVAYLRSLLQSSHSFL